MKRKITVRSIWRYIGVFYVLTFEKVLTNSKWFNPFATLYLNLRCVPLKQALKFPVFVFGRPRLYSTFGHIRFPDGCKQVWFALMFLFLMDRNVKLEIQN